MSHATRHDRTRLICVYNADTGLIEGLIHAVHKAVRPETYPCSLCALTYGAVSMSGDWKAFWKGLDAEVEFYHRDDFTRDFPEFGDGGPREVPLPVIMIIEASAEPRVLISDKELGAMADVEELMARVERELRASVR
ncbi:hypothetical protein INR77_15055 [Erythrobacter sp. SCSIO 43205]|uniref:hypothetical protein n=1 Tax=Erythrobacter sp. SCSIO 43205 TaxID=2779361 RepID=UPI001CA9BFC0|nr:hypothetical protein [Erythrobacter sp. SCSIO 43205]UAB78055.1 hypothetical protein INR77_15055 [Erythrobacter sp. SCSIO 43205]